MNSRRDSLLLPWVFGRKTKEDALHKWAKISRWKHSCDNWSRPDNVSPSTIGEVAQISQNQYAHFWRKIKEIRTGWRSAPTKSENPQPTDRPQQKKLNPLFHAWWRTTNLQNITSFNRENREKIWLCSVENTWNLSQWLQRNTGFNDWSSIRQSRS